MWRWTDLPIQIKSSTFPKAELSLYAMLLSKLPAPAAPSGRYVSSNFLFMPENGIILWSPYCHLVAVPFH